MLLFLHIKFCRDYISILECNKQKSITEFFFVILIPHNLYELVDKKHHSRINTDHCKPLLRFIVKLAV